MRFTVLYTVLALLACRAERVDPAQEQRASELAVRPIAASNSAMGALSWGDKIAWHSWDSALPLAQAQAKPIALVVYAEWCARCKELAPLFATPEVARAAEGLVMVHQDQDKPAPWLKEKLGAYGSYVPRVFFLTPDGQVREDLVSGHPRYPHFYAPMVADQLLANMHAARAR